MKKNLGKIIILLLALYNGVFASELANYKFTVNKKEAVVKEPVEITFTARQQEHKNAMFFFVRPHKSSNYTIKLLTKTIDDKAYHNTTATFKYLLFPLHAKKIKVDFDFTVKTASDKSIANAYVEDHDDSKSIQMDVHTLKVNPLIINIRPLAHKVDLVGDFTLNSKIDTQNINQYGNVNLYYILQGSGFDEASLTILHPIKNVTLFSDISTLYKHLSTHGEEFKRNYIYSLSATKSFTIPAVILQAYSPTKHKYYKLQTPSYHINVHKVDTSKLIDAQEAPKKEPFISFKTLKQTFIYLFVFLSGYLLAKLTQNGLFPKKKERKFQDIRNAKSPQELVNILLQSYEHYKLHSYIDELERLAYKKEGRKFETIKKSLLQEIEKSM